MLPIFLCKFCCSQKFGYAGVIFKMSMGKLSIKLNLCRIWGKGLLSNFNMRHLGWGQTFYKTFPYNFKLYTMYTWCYQSLESTETPVHILNYFFNEAHWTWRPSQGNSIYLKLHNPFSHPPHISTCWGHRFMGNLSTSLLYLKWLMSCGEVIITALQGVGGIESRYRLIYLRASRD